MKTDFKDSLMPVKDIMSKLSTELYDVGRYPTPGFQSYSAGADAVVASAKKITNAYGDFKNLIVVGCGGSISSLDALYTALIMYSKPGEYSDPAKRLFIVDSQEPGPINKILLGCGKEDSLVLAISKSGNTQGVLDVVGVFSEKGYNIAAITSKDGILRGVVEGAIKKKGLSDKVSDLIVEHPEVGGRYCGRTNVATLPLALIGVGKQHLQSLEDGAQNMYFKVNTGVPLPDNQALHLAASLKIFEDKGRDQVFAPMYSHLLSGFSHLITQLMHESSGKAGVGQTMLTLVAPEFQHNTSQRMLDGKNNVCVVFFTVEKHDSQGLKTLDGIPLGKALHFEYLGAIGAAKKKKIPSFTISAEELTPYCVGELMAFSQYAFGVYPALLRRVNPYDQPAVEAGKKISRQLRKDYLKK